MSTNSYRVTVVLEMHITVNVRAENAEKAESLARSEADQTLKLVDSLGLTDWLITDVVIDASAKDEPDNNS